MEQNQAFEVCKQELADTKRQCADSRVTVQQCEESLRQQLASVQSELTQAQQELHTSTSKHSQCQRELQQIRHCSEQLELANKAKQDEINMLRMEALTQAQAAVCIVEFLLN